MTGRETPLPASILVIERGWLSSNSIVLASGAGNALVDSGYVAHAAETLARVERALQGEALARLVNTHCHSDHMGGNRAIAERTGCRVGIPLAIAPAVEAWDERVLLLGYADQRAERFGADELIEPGATLRLGEFDWQALAAPGHDNTALMFHAPAERILISGDALWENGFGVLFPWMYGREQNFDETQATLDAIARLDPRWVIPGHGRPFRDVTAALDRAYSRLAGYRADPERLVRHALKVMLVFSLLDRRRLALAELPGYLDSVGISRELNARHLRLAPGALAAYLVGELEKAGAVRREDGMLVPLVAA